MNPSKPNNNLPTLVGLSAVIMWSSTVGLFRSVSEIFGATGGAALIFTVGGLLACLVLGFPKLNTFPRPYLWIGGALFVAYEVALALSIGFALNREQAIELGMINYLWPSLTILFAVLAGQQRGSWLLLPALLMSFCGIVLVVKGDSAWSVQMLWQNMAGNPTGYGLAFFAAGTWAVYSVFTRRFGNGVNGVPLFLVVTAIVLWGKYALGNEPALSLHIGGLLQVAVMGALMAAAYSCWNHGIQHGNITILATMSCFTPVLSALIANLWLGTTPSTGLVYGVAMVTAGSFLCWAVTRRNALDPGKH